jgi:flagellar hook-length control protein FliK
MAPGLRIFPETKIGCNVFMSNLAMANLIPAAAGQRGTATGKTAVAKQDSASSKMAQVDVEKQVTDVKEGVDSGMFSAKSTGKFSFNDLLKKHLAHDTSKDQSGTLQCPMQTIVNTEVTSEKKTVGDKTKKLATDSLVPIMSFLPQALQPSKTRSFAAVTNVKPLQNVPLRAIGLTKTVAAEGTKGVNAVPVENTKTMAGKEVTAAKSTVKESKPLSSVEQKEAKAVAEKEVPNPEKTVKIGVIESKTNVSQAKQGVEQAGVNLSAESNTVGKDKIQLTYSQSQVHTTQTHTAQAHTVTEVTKTDKSKLTPPKTQEKAQTATATATETSENTQTVIASRPAEVITPVLNRHAGTESVSAAAVTTTPTVKSDVSQAVMTPSEQIINKVQNTITGSTQQIQVTLNPAELGVVRITFRQQDGQIEGLMEIQNPQVRKDVEKALPQIAAALAQNGIQVRRMDIVPMQNQQQSNQDAFGHPEPEYNLTDQHYLSNNGGSGESGQSGGRTGGQDAQLANELQTQVQQQQGYDASGLNMFA